MNVLMVSKACVVGAYQRKLEAIAARGVELTVVVPAAWRDPSGVRVLERRYTQGYRLLVWAMRFSGHFDLTYSPTLGGVLAEIRTMVLHVAGDQWMFEEFDAV